MVPIISGWTLVSFYAELQNLLRNWFYVENVIMKARLQNIDSYLILHTDFYLMKKPKYFSKVHFILKKKEFHANPFK